MKCALFSTAFAHLHLTIIDYDRPPGEQRNELWNTTPVEILPKYPEERVTDGCRVVGSDRGSVSECVSDEENGFIIDVADAGHPHSRAQRHRWQPGGLSEGDPRCD